MKRILAALTLALFCSVALAVSAANATHSKGTGPNYDFVNGSGIFDFLEGGTQKLHVNAKSAADGSQPQGKVFVQSKGNSPAGFDVDLKVDVTCFHVVGNSASIGGEVTRSNSPDFPVGSGALIFVTDNGEPGDQDSFFGNRTETPPEVCPAPEPRSSENSGDFIVHDATL
jgi:hypothetical protein